MRHLRLLAEATCWPLSDPRGLLDAPTHLLPSELRAGLRDRLARYGHVPHPDDLGHAAWQNTPGTAPASVLAHIVHVARGTLRHDGATMRLSDHSLNGTLPSFCVPGEEILWWRLLSLRVPAAIWICAAVPQGCGIPDRVEVLDSTLRPEGPVGHLHVHQSNVNAEEEVWATVLDVMKEHPKDPLASPIPGDDRGVLWKFQLESAQVAWSILVRHTQEAHRGELATCGACLGNATMAHTLVAFASSDWRGSHDAPVDDKVLGQARKLRGVQTPGWDRVVLHHLLQSAAGGRLAPTTLAIVTQVLRVRTLLHQQIALDPTSPGLGHFTEVFNRSFDYARAPGGAAALARLAGDALKVAAVEVRGSLPSKRSAASKRLQQLDKDLREAADPKKSPLEAGFVMHLIRSVSPAWNNGCPWPTLWRERALRPQRRLTDWLVDHPESLQVIRGLDVAGRELDGPLFLFAPSIRCLRELSTSLAGLEPSIGLRPLRLTLHVGEDFRHLASGLRAIDEPIAWGLVQRGDRLGHALALGVSPTSWAAKEKLVYQPRLERLLDIGWMLDAVVRLRLDAPASTFHRLRHEAQCLVQAIWKVDCPHGLSRRLWRGLGQPEHHDASWGSSWTELALQKPVGAPRPDPTRPASLVASLFHDPETWQRSQHRVPVSTTDELDLLIQAQDKLAEHIAAMQLTIEVNPTSNLLIADLDAPLDQPMFRLRPIDPNDKRALPVCISTDDPLTFATSLADEYAYAWAGMVVAGNVPPSFARQWLDEAAAASWRARFTLPLP